MTVVIMIVFVVVFVVVAAAAAAAPATVRSVVAIDCVQTGIAGGHGRRCSKGPIACDFFCLDIIPRDLVAYEKHSPIVRQNCEKKTQATQRNGQQETYR